MRIALLLGAVFVVGTLSWSCRSGDKAGGGSSDVMTHTCAACKDVVTWSYNTKGIPTGAKRVEHTCPGCKKDWAGNVSAGNTCAECAKAMCPACRKAGG